MQTIKLYYDELRISIDLKVDIRKYFIKYSHTI